MLYQLSYEELVHLLGSFVPVKDSMNEMINECIFEARVIDESLWSHQIGGIGVYKRQLNQ